MRLCNKCGSEVPENSAFCHGCGERYEGAQPSVPDATASQATPPVYPSQFDTSSQQAEQQILVPLEPLSTNRSLVKLILLSIITLGIYFLIFHYRISRDINSIASRYDGKKTMNFLWFILIMGLPVFVIGVIAGIAELTTEQPVDMGWTYLISALFAIPVYVWYHRISNRVGAELSRRGISHNFNASTYWTFYGGPSIISYVAIFLPQQAFWWINLAVVIVTFMYFHKLCVAFNQLAEHYNANG